MVLAEHVSASDVEDAAVGSRRHRVHLDALAEVHRARDLGAGRDRVDHLDRGVWLTYAVRLPRISTMSSGPGRTVLFTPRTVAGEVVRSSETNWRSPWSGSPIRASPRRPFAEGQRVDAAVSCGHGRRHPRSQPRCGRRCGGRRRDSGDGGQRGDGQGETAHAGGTGHEGTSGRRRRWGRSATEVRAAAEIRRCPGNLRQNSRALAGSSRMPATSERKREPFSPSMCRWSKLRARVVT